MDTQSESLDRSEKMRQAKKARGLTNLNVFVSQELIDVIDELKPVLRVRGRGDVIERLIRDAVDVENLREEYRRQTEP